MNQYGEEDPSPTGCLARDVATALREEGNEVEVLSCQAAYRSGPKGGMARIRRELASLWHLRQLGQRVRRPDLLLSFSSPPLLAAVARGLARRHRCPHVHWALDLYPELATALGVLRSRWIGSMFRSWMHRAYREASTVVTLDADMVETFRAMGVTAAEIPPWPYPSQLACEGVLPQKPKTPFWMYSGNLGRAHEWRALAEIQAKLEQGAGAPRLVVQGGGWALPLLREEVRKLQLRHLQFSDYLPESRLLGSLMVANVLVVSMRPEVRGLLWPSKLALALLSGRPVLFLGSPDSSPARAVENAGGRAFRPDQTEAAAHWVREQCGKPVSPSSADLMKMSQAAWNLAAKRKKAWLNLLEAAARRAPVI